MREREIALEEKRVREAEENIERKKKLEKLLTNLNERLRVCQITEELANSAERTEEFQEVKAKEKGSGEFENFKREVEIANQIESTEESETENSESLQDEIKIKIKEREKKKKTRKNKREASKGNRNKKRHRKVSFSSISTSTTSSSSSSSTSSSDDSSLESTSTSSEERNKKKRHKKGGKARKSLRRIPVSEWKLKYDGKDQGRRLAEFLKEVKMRCKSEDISEKELFRGAIHLFSGRAKDWFMEGFENRDFRNWSGLKKELKQVTLKTASGSPVEVEGYVHLPVTFNNENKIISALVAPTLKRRLILGYNDFWRSFGLQPTVQTDQSHLIEGLEDVYEDVKGEEGENDREVLTSEQNSQLEDVKKLFKVAIEGEILDVTPILSHRIELKEEYQSISPVRINPYPTSPEMQNKINVELDKMLSQKVIEPSKSDWALSTVPVIKPTGEVRLCLDARRLNDRTRRDAYPLPHQDRILSRLGSSRFLTTIDLTKAFLQIPLDPSSRKYTAFSVLGRGLFQFTRLPFGLVNSPATLARLMDEVLGYGELEPSVFVYLDDIVVASSTFEAHIQSLKEVGSVQSARNFTEQLNVMSNVLRYHDDIVEVNEDIRSNTP
ncbi:uncharacterized protein LOC134202723 [Armigeres subalbatus]|uniref:uncharacterized protein LOC134202723 n=1 Tax=Armigeres subalbatus TaxID=124917 RepID=UPI002ED1A8A5